VLCANSSTCDLFVYGADNCLRIFNPKANSLRCVQVLRPQLLEHSFLRSSPGFWQEALPQQAQLVRRWLGTHGDLEMAHEVVDMRLDERSGLVALIGVRRISILVLPCPSGASPPAAATDELSHLLAHLGLSEYGNAFRDKGYDNIHALSRMSIDERARMASDVGLKPGHAQTLSMQLDGRLPAVPPSTPAIDSDEATRCWAMPLAVLGSTSAALNESGAVPAGADASNDLRSPTSAFRSGGLVVRSEARLDNGMSDSMHRMHTLTEQPEVVLRRVPRFASSANPATGVGVVQAEWHPLGESHIGVLLSDGSFQLFDVAKDLETPIMSLSVPVDAGGASRTGTGTAAEVDDDAVPDVAGFCFGSPEHPGWSSLSVFFASASGAVYVACPVLPNGDRARQHVQLMEQTLGDDAPHETRVWLQRNAVDLGPSHDFPAPKMQGPLLTPASTSSPREPGGRLAFRDDSPTPPGRMRPAAASAGSSTLAISCKTLSNGLVAIFLGRADGKVSIGIVNGSLRPRWAKVLAPPPSALPSTAAALATPGCTSRARPSVAWMASPPAPMTSGRSTGLLPRRSRSAPANPTTLPSERAHGVLDDAYDGSSVPFELEFTEMSTARLPNVSEPLRWMQIVVNSCSSERLFVYTSSGSLSVIHIAWLQPWGRFLTNPVGAASLPPPPAPPAASSTQELSLCTAISPTQPAARVVGVAALRDPSLGDSIFAMRNDGTCTRARLEEAPAAPSSMETGTQNRQMHAHFAEALKQLAHHRQTFNASGGKDGDDLAWRNSTGALKDASQDEIMSRFSESLFALAGPNSTLRCWGELVEETKDRLTRVSEQAEAQPANDKAIIQAVADLSVHLEMLGHKAKLVESIQVMLLHLTFASLSLSPSRVISLVSRARPLSSLLLSSATVVVQANLEQRIQALRSVLRTPVLWPCGDVSEEEERQVRRNFPFASLRLAPTHILCCCRISASAPRWPP